MDEHCADGNPALGTSLFSFDNGFAHEIGHVK
jgi:hypothetical protein